MPMSAAEFNKMDPDVRAFYKNADAIWNIPTSVALLVATTYFVHRAPSVIAKHNLDYQEALVGTRNLDTVYFVENWVWTTPNPALMFDIYTIELQADAWYWMPILGADFGTYKTKVRKSYWTGISRPRRNR